MWDNRVTSSLRDAERSTPVDRNRSQPAGPAPGCPDGQPFRAL